MNRLSLEKRNQLIAAVAVIAVLLFGLWFGLIRNQQQKLSALAEQRDEAERKASRMQAAIKNASQVEADLGEASAKVQKMEAGMATGDLYAWVINMIKDFKQPYKVEIPQFSQIDGPRDVTLLAKFPYKQATLAVGGTALFPDLGRFLADFENQFPYFRIQNLIIEPATGLNPGDREKLSFRMEIVVLVKPETT